MTNEVVNLLEKFSLFHEAWNPKIVAQINDYHIKIVRVEGDFTWHEHEDTDEVFIVLEGKLRIDLENRQILIGEGELFVVPKGTRHKPFAETECKILLVEPAGTINTGNSGGRQTAPDDVWL